MSELHIYQGLPASGKSSDAIKLVQSSTEYIRVNRDEIRAQFTTTGAKWSGSREKNTVLLRNAMIRAGLEAGKTVLCDDTNLDPKVVAELRGIAVESKAKVVMVDFRHVGPQECIKRDLARERTVGANVILRMYRDYMLPEPVVQDPSLQHIIIADLDGTLALCGDRDIYDDAKADRDHINPPVATMVQSYLTANPNTLLVCMSGRDEGRSRDVTLKWLKEKGLEHHALIMRPAGDTRHDNIIKRELFDAYIRGKFFVDFVVDDRDQVVQMWRDDLGLPTFQVAWGNF